jgi:hypothetical protein
MSMSSQGDRDAASHGATDESAPQYVLTESALAARRELIEKLSKLHAKFEAKYGLLPDSTPGIREERDSRG